MSTTTIRKKYSQNCIQLQIYTEIWKKKGYIIEPITLLSINQILEEKKKDLKSEQQQAKTTSMTK